jgi:hypothetical protein
VPICPQAPIINIFGFILKKFKDKYNDFANR